MSRPSTIGADTIASAQTQDTITNIDRQNVRNLTAGSGSRTRIRMKRDKFSNTTPSKPQEVVDLHSISLSNMM